MAGNWLRRSLLRAAGAATLGALGIFGLAACGSGTIDSQLKPSRVVVFGDGMADIRTPRYTINDGTINNWTITASTAFGVDVVPTTSGGFSYATGNARVANKPDAAGDSTTLTVTEQITSFLSASRPTANDLVIVNAGTSDVVAEAAAAIAGRQTSDQALANLRTAGRALGAQVRRLVDAGATHVVVVGPYNMGRSAWAVQTSQQRLLEDASSRFNEDLLVSIVDLGANVLYVDAALHYNLVTGNASLYNMASVTDVVCTSTDAGNGIGTGTGQVNSRLCTPSTLIAADLDTGRYLWADRVYPTGQGQRLFGDYAYSRIRQRW